MLIIVLMEDDDNHDALYIHTVHVHLVVLNAVSFSVITFQGGAQSTPCWRNVEFLHNASWYSSFRPRPFLCFFHAPEAGPRPRAAS